MLAGRLLGAPFALQGSLCMSCRRVSDLLIEFSLDWRRAAVSFL